jgi:hypothetical protein
MAKIRNAPDDTLDPRQTKTATCQGIPYLFSAREPSYYEKCRVSRHRVRGQAVWLFIGSGAGGDVSAGPENSLAVQCLLTPA